MHLNILENSNIKLQEADKEMTIVTQKSRTV